MSIHQNGTEQEDILIVDDTPENLRLLSLMLSKKGYHVRKSLSGKAAIVSAQTVTPDLILLDIMMPEMNGYEVCQHLKTAPETAQVPVIFLSALNEAFDKVKAFQVGGTDFITKPFQLEEVLTRVQNQLAIKRRSNEIRRLNTELEERVKERTKQLELVNQELVQEIVERKRVQAQLLEMALHDGLTGLPNRSLFMERLGQELKRISTNPAYQFAVLFLDCDRFKIVNDSLGHLIGDELLIAIAHRLKGCLKTSDTIARLGGDEFAILLPELQDVDGATQLAYQLLKALSQPFQLSKWQVFIGASIGIVIGHAGYTQPEYLLRDADTAMYRAKASGKSQYQIFDSTMHDAALQLLHLETDLRRAVEQQEFVLHYQPIVTLSTGKIVGFEALLRWQHPEQGLVVPGEFIAIAEETGLIVSIGEWVLKTACSQLHDWQQQGLANEQFTISINLSARQFVQSDLVRQIDGILAETQINPRNLKLEITESIILDNTNAVADTLKNLRERQIHLSIDDFGTGYSSLSYLHAFPVDSLKIDRSFIQGLDENSETLGLVPAITNIARAMQMSVVAEGIETPEQLDQLRRLKCDFGQGYLFSRPIPVEQATELLISDICW